MVVYLLCIADHTENLYKKKQERTLLWGFVQDVRN